MQVIVPALAIDQTPTLQLIEPTYHRTSVAEITNAGPVSVAWRCLLEGWLFCGVESQASNCALDHTAVP
jgi:hypothetical protein